jgi:hypothetical protein
LLFNCSNVVTLKNNLLYLSYNYHYKNTEDFQHIKMKAKKFSQLKERIRLFAKNQGISMREIYEKTGISDGTFSNSSGLNEENLLKLFSYFSDLDANWLLTGQGSMKKELGKGNFSLEETNQHNEDKYILALQKKMIQKLEKELEKLKQAKK